MEQHVIPLPRVLIEFTSSAKGEVQPTIRVEAEGPQEAVSMLDALLIQVRERGKLFKVTVEEINGRSFSC